MASFRKAGVGDPLAIQAAEFNGWQRAAAFVDNLDRSIRRRPSLSLRNSGVVLIRNDSGDAVDRFGILGIDGPLIDPDDNLDRFAEQITLSGITPNADHAGAFAVLVDPLREGATGRATVDGVCAAHVEMTNSDDRLADAKPGSTSELRSDSGSGSARILWAGAPNSGISLCVVKLGLAGGGGTAVNFAVISSKAGTSPPYIYSATQSYFDPAISGMWAAVSGGDVISGNMYNVEEFGQGGQYVNPLLPGDPVVYVRAPNNVDAFLCWRSHYRGTYG